MLSPRMLLEQVAITEMVVGVTVGLRHPSNRFENIRRSWHLSMTWRVSQ